MKKVVVLYGGLNERIGAIKIIRDIYQNRINNVKTFFDDGERNFDFDELSYFAGILNYAMQRNPEIIILHEIRSKEVIEKLMSAFQCEIYTMYIGKYTSNKHDITITVNSDENLETQIKEIFEKLI